MWSMCTVSLFNKEEFASQDCTMKNDFVVGFTLNDLKNGDIVQDRLNDLRIVVDRDMVGTMSSFTNFKNQFNTDLTFIDNHRLDIMRVYRGSKFISDIDKSKLIFERIDTDDEDNPMSLDNLIKIYEEKACWSNCNEEDGAVLRYLKELKESIK